MPLLPFLRTKHWEREHDVGELPSQTPTGSGRDYSGFILLVRVRGWANHIDRVGWRGLVAVPLVSGAALPSCDCQIIKAGSFIC